jgi:hypothetical protein
MKRTFKNGVIVNGKSGFYKMRKGCMERKKSLLFLLYNKFFVLPNCAMRLCVGHVDGIVRCIVAFSLDLIRGYTIH